MGHHSATRSMRAFMRKAQEQRDPRFAADVRATSELLYQLMRRLKATEPNERRLVSITRDLARGAVSLEKAGVYYDKNIVG